MRYVIEYFDGEDVRGVLVEQTVLEEVMDEISHCEEEQGCVVLDVTPEEVWRDRKVAHPVGGLNPRYLPVDQLMS
uniref:Uncharacterized protein n=1 Tax=Magnetococcus massalia (strain MO-1) TaxID=451514 RepID=A0A1S7LKP7_MAGMO|nr:protein of unknown function [Candidatus Magnetococcus massalia]